MMPRIVPAETISHKMTTATDNICEDTTLTNDVLLCEKRTGEFSTYRSNYFEEF